MSDVEYLNKRIRELEAAFIKYTAHQMKCDLRRPCSCGWDDTVDALGLRTKATANSACCATSSGALWLGKK